MRRDLEISARMQALAQMVTPGHVVCDVGCDHGYLSIYLVQKKISPKVIAMDVRSGPLSACREHVEQYGLEQYITMRLSDGLTALLPDEADAVVCAGMGGRLMQKILTEGRDKAAGLKELILQPQSELMEFRRFLREQGYTVIEENMIEEEGKFYPMMKAVHQRVEAADRVQAGSEDSVCDRFGALLLTSAHPVLYRFLKQREALLQTIRGSILSSAQTDTGTRLKDIDQELTDIHTAYKYY